MKNKSLLFVLFLLLTELQTSNAALTSKKSRSESVLNKSLTASSQTVGKQSMMLSWLKREIVQPFKNIFHPYQKEGTNGDLALLFGILSLIPVVGLLFSIPAIIFGKIGKENNEKFAKAGFIMGWIQPVLAVIAVVIILGLILSVFIGIIHYH